MSLPEVHLAGGTCAEALRLVPVALAMREQGLVAPILLAGGPEPTAVAKTYIAGGLAADVTLPASADLGVALRRYDQLWAVRTPAAVVVRGDNLGAALAAYWRRVPVMHMDAGRRSGSLVADDADADRRLLATQEDLLLKHVLSLRQPDGDTIGPGTVLSGLPGLPAGSRLDPDRLG